MPGITGRLEPLVLRGSLTRFRRRCGKANCHCAGGEPHESPALVYSEDGRTKTLTLAAGEVAEVAAALDRYEIAKAQLDAAANAGIASLRARRAGPPRAGERP
ncbi:MAG: DUF6788 family protein [Acidimicrobiales bacterium]